MERVGQLRGPLGLGFGSWAEWAGEGESKRGRRRSHGNDSTNQAFQILDSFIFLENIKKK